MNGLGFPFAAVFSAAATLLPYFLGNKNKASSASTQSTQSTQNTQSTQAPQQQRVIVVMQKEKNYTKYIAIAAALVIGYVILNDKK